ncbi:autoinducer 2 (AI-2) kinase [Bacillus tianshenii]|uniref:Autoinducer 2 (AI-2) kinase n=1 Tax=Sutcliffiella tianshenii TaxID=1463404 RepID=A0ABS2NX41_9BACI|nr:autoinducer-2 kinase [Bacillus tianshenii]MBM7619204.1 autoinducer 2 (AI-2) kinase [Bacillus tianshenii]
MDYVLAFDAGTGSIRAVLFDRKGQQIGVSQKEWTHLPDEGVPGSMNFDTASNWELVIHCVKEVLQDTGILPSDIKAVSATSMREGFVLYNQNGQEIWACANVDARAGVEVSDLKMSDEKIEMDLYAESGQTFALGAIPRLLWLKKHKPEIYEATSCITMINDWILYKLSGILQVDPSNGCTSGIFNLEKREWQKQIASRCEIKDSIFPKVHEAGTVLGKVSIETAALTGLCPETLVVSGGGDAQMASVGVGAISTNQTVVSGGSFWQQEVNVEKPYMDPKGRLRVNCHAVEGQWQLEAIAFFPGLVMRWFRDAFCEKEVEEAKITGRDAYEILEEKAQHVPAGSNGIIPVFSDVMNYVSWRHAAPSFINLSIDPQKTGKMEMFRSLQENAALITLGNLKLIEEVTGHYPEEVIFAGGASKGRLWSQTLADVLGVPVKVPVIKEAAALGTALYAAIGAGIYSSIKEAADSVVVWERTFQPRMGNHHEYLKIYEKWRKVYESQLNLADRGVTTHMWKAPGL